MISSPIPPSRPRVATRSELQWLDVLRRCDAKPQVAARWARIFAEVIKPDSFSRGDAELPDFIGQVMHESAMLERLEENLNYSAARIVELGQASKPGTRWRSMVPQATKLAYNPKAFAEACYGGRLGNVKPGDGFKYRGRGLVMVTGFDNYALVSKATGLDLINNPDLLGQPAPALKAAIAWWEGRVPDAAMGDVRKVTRAVNGGDFGLAHRLALTERAAQALA